MFLPSISLGQEHKIDCGSCYAQKDQECKNSCSAKIKDPSSGKFQKCKRSCVLEACNNYCNYEIKSGQKENLPEVANCDYCFRYAAGPCSSKCEGKGVSCIRRCQSDQCNKTCPLPYTPDKILDNKESNDPKADCKACKIAQEETCTGNCGNGAGSMTCKVTCIERNCEKSCLID